MTPLMWAARNDNEDVVRALLDSGADIEAQNNVSKRMLNHICKFVLVFQCTLKLNLYVISQELTHNNEITITIIILVSIFIALLTAHANTTTRDKLQR